MQGYIQGYTQGYIQGYIQVYIQVYIRARRLLDTTLIGMNKPGNPQHDHIDTHTRQPWWPGIISIVAERMSRRAMRRATTFPMLATFGANALAVELCRRGEDHEAIAAAAGIQYVSQLRKVAGVLPHAAQAGAKIVVAANTLLAESLLKAGEAVKVHDYSCTKKSNDTQ